ncbi:MAG: hypothetical protein LBJ10_02350, partial [Clostridiales bacterium]|nr:hypothetical protein [Clostridiales bacterium]
LDAAGADIDMGDAYSRNQMELARLFANSEVGISLISGLGIDGGQWPPEFGAGAVWNVGGRKLLSLEAFFGGGEFLVKFPELSAKALSVPLPVDDMLAGLAGTMDPASLGKISEYAERAAPIIARLLPGALEHIEYAEASAETLTLGGEPAEFDVVELGVTQRGLVEAARAVLLDVRGDEEALGLVEEFWNDLAVSAYYQEPIQQQAVVAEIDALLAQLDAFEGLSAGLRAGVGAGDAAGVGAGDAAGGADTAASGAAGEPGTTGAGADSAAGPEVDFTAGAIPKIKIYLADGAFAGLSVSSGGGYPGAPAKQFGFAADAAKGYSIWINTDPGDGAGQVDVEFYGSTSVAAGGRIEGDARLRDAEGGEVFDMKLFDFSILPPQDAPGERRLDYTITAGVGGLVDAFSGKEDSEIMWVADMARSLAGNPMAEFFRGAVFTIDVSSVGWPGSSHVALRAEDSAKGASAELRFGMGAAPAAPARPSGEVFDAGSLYSDPAAAQELLAEIMGGANGLLDDAAAMGYDLEWLRGSVNGMLGGFGGLAGFGYGGAADLFPPGGDLLQEGAGAVGEFGMGGEYGVDGEYALDGEGDPGAMGDPGDEYGLGDDGAWLRDYVELLMDSGEFSTLYGDVGYFAEAGGFPADFGDWFFSLEQIQRRVSVAAIEHGNFECAYSELELLGIALGEGYADEESYAAAAEWLTDALQASGEAAETGDSEFFSDAYAPLPRAG